MRETERPRWKLALHVSCLDAFSEACVMSGRVGRTAAAAAAAAVLLLCVQSLHSSALPAVSSYEFTAYRMQQFNLVQQKHGEFRCQSCSTMEVKHAAYEDTFKKCLRL